MNKSYLLSALDNGEYQLIELPDTIILDHLDKETVQAVLFILKAAEHRKELDNKKLTFA